LGQHVLALSYHRVCLEAVTARRVTDRRFCMHLLKNIANEYHFLGNSGQALAYYREARRYIQPGEDNQAEAYIYWGMGKVYLSRKNYGFARLYLHKSATLLEKCDDLTQAGAVYGILGMAMTECGDFRRGEAALQYALKLVNRREDDYARHLAFVNLAFCYLRQGRLAEAEDQACQSLELARKTGNKLAIADCLAQLAEIKIARAGLADGAGFFEEAIEVLQATDFRENLVKLYCRYAEALEKAGQINEALQVLKKSFE
jgi:tetratricopeptide (TPR) repeat protein